VVTWKLSLSADVSSLLGAYCSDSSPLGVNGQGQTINKSSRLPMCYSCKFIVLPGIAFVRPNDSFLPFSAMEISRPPGLGNTSQRPITPLALQYPDQPPLEATWSAFSSNSQGIWKVVSPSLTLQGTFSRRPHQHRSRNNCNTPSLFGPLIWLDGLPTLAWRTLEMWTRRVGQIGPATHVDNDA